MSDEPININDVPVLPLGTRIRVTYEGVVVAMPPESNVAAMRLDNGAVIQILGIGYIEEAW